MAADIATLDIRVQTSSLDDAGKKLDSVAKNAGETEKATDRLQKSFDGLKGVIFGVVGAIGGLKLTQYIQEAVLLAARYETLGVVMNTAGRNAGYSAQQMDKFERSLRSQGIAMVEARRTLSMLAAAQMDLEKSGALARAAQDLAVVGGINSSEAFERLVRGIRSGEIEVLRTIGLNINFEQSYKKAAAQLGKNADQLASHEKLIIRQNAALEEAAKFMGIYEASMSTAGKQLSSMERYLQDFKTLIGELGVNTLGVAVFGANDAFKKMNEELTRMRDAGELAVMSRTIGENIRAAAGAAMDAAVAFGMWYAAARGMMVLNAVNAAITAATANAAGLAGALVQGSLVASQFGKAMLAAVGGPWVLGLSVAAFGIYKLATHQSEAEKVARSHTSALKDVDKALAGAAGSAAAFAEAVKDASKSQLELAKIDLERKLEGIRASSKALGTDLQQAFGREGLQGMLDFSGADIEARDLAERFGFSQIVRDLNDGKLSAIDAAVAFEKLRRDMEQSGTATGNFTGFLADAADKLRLMAGNDVEMNKLAQAMDHVSEAMRNMSSATKQGAADVGEVIAKAAEYVKSLPNVRQEADTKTYTTLKADLESVIKEGGEKAKEARALLANVEAAHKANQEGFAKKLASSSKDAETKARDLASALRDINEILADMTGDEKAVRLAKWGDTMAKLTKGLNGDKAGLARLAEADKSMRAAIDSGFESPQSMRRERKTIEDEFERSMLGDGAYAMKQVWDKSAKARALGIPEENVVRYELEAISKLMADYSDKNLETEREFNKEMLEMSGRTTEARILDIEKQAEVWAKAGIDAVRIEQWKTEKILQASRDWKSGAVRAMRSYRDSALDMGKQVEDSLTRAFSSLEDVIVSFARSGKLSFKAMADSMISDMARITARQMLGNMAMSAGFASNASNANAAGGSPAGGTSNLLGMVPWSNMMPGGMMAGAVDTINGWGAAALPAIFGNGLVGGGPAALAAGSAGGASASLAAAEAAAGLSSAGSMATLTGTLGAAGIAGGLGMLAGSLIAPGRPTVGYGMGGGAAAGAAIGSVVPVLGTVVGGIVGGVLGGLGGSLFGGGGKKAPAAFTMYGASLDNLSIAHNQFSDLLSVRNGGDKDAAAPVLQQLQAVVDVAANDINTIRSIIPAKYSDGLNKALAETYVTDSFDWKQNKDAPVKEFVERLTSKLYGGIFEALSTVNMSDLGLTYDLSNQAGLQRFSAGLAQWKAVQDTITATIAPLSQYEQAVNAANGQMDGWIKSLRDLGWQEQKLAEVEGKRAEMVAKATEAMRTAYDLDMRVREAQVGGTDWDVQREQLKAQQERERTQAKAQWGADSAEYKRIVAMQAAEMSKAAADIEATRATEALSAAKSAYLDGLNTEASRLSDLTRRFKDLGKVLGDLRTGLLLDDKLTTLGPVARYDLAGSQLNALIAKANGGDAEAMEALQSTSRAYLEASLAYNADFEAYRQDFDRVQGMLRSVEQEATEQSSVAELQLQAINREIETIQGVGDRIVASLEQLRSNYASASHASAAASAPASGGSTGGWDDDAYVRNKAAQLNASGYQDPTYTGGGAWTAWSVHMAFAAAGLSPREHYLQYGINEGIKPYARGGLAAPGWALVGEEGPELIDLATPGRVYTADDTARMLRGGGGNAELVQEIRALRAEVTQLRAEQARGLYAVADNTGQAARTLRKFDGDGMPTTRPV